jgi:hypothetical protein
MNIRKMILLIFLVSTLFFSGCSKINQEHYTKIKIGMEQKDVVVILGNATKCDSVLGASNCIWGDADKNITIKFIADQVMFTTSKGL